LPHAALYLRHANLSNEEDELLWNAFAPSMPVMRQAFESGRVKRAKT
jgi:hypothetical protein